MPHGGAALPRTAPLDPAAIWQSTYHWNGMAVYREGHTTGAHAVAAAMRASPKDVFQHFIRSNDGTCAWDLFHDCTVLDAVPDNDHKLVRHSVALLPDVQARCDLRAAQQCHVRAQ